MPSVDWQGSGVSTCKAAYPRGRGCLGRDYTCPDGLGKNI